MAPYAAGIPGEVRVVYLPASHAFAALHGNVFLREMEPEDVYRAILFDPITGEAIECGAIDGNEAGGARFPRPPVIQDWVLVLERR